MLWRKQRGMGQGELGGPTFRRGSGKAPLRGDVRAGPWRIRRSGSGKELEEKGWQSHLASEEGARSWAHHGAPTPFLSNYSHKVNENWSRQLTGHLTLDEKEWKLQRDTQDTLPWQAVSLIQPITVKSKGSNGTGRAPLPKSSFLISCECALTWQETTLLALKGLKKKKRWIGIELSLSLKDILTEIFQLTVKKIIIEEVTGLPLESS